MLAVAKLVILTGFCLFQAACSTSGQISAANSKTAAETKPLTSSDEIETPTLQKTSTSKVTATALPAEATATLTPFPPLTPTPTTMPCWAQGGRFELDELESQLLPVPLSYRIYLPPCYDEQTERRYPVLYLIHGQSYNDDQWERLGAGSVVDWLSAGGELPPFIIVMPRDRVWKEPTEDNFGSSVAEELVPWIDDNYRTYSERQYRAVGGLSRGGAWALHLGLRNWDLFEAVGAHSGFIFHTDTYLVKSWLDEIPIQEMPRIYMDAGDNDRPPILQSAVWFEDLLTQRGIPHEWHIYSGYHEEAYWQAHLEEYLRWYASEWVVGE
jgi:enterochelin esterase-like enzyme